MIRPPSGDANRPGPLADRYDVVIAGARVAGASTALLLARQGLRVLIVDPMRRGSDTLSTHALMRGAVLQLERWGVLDAIKAAGTPTIRSTSFHYGAETITVPIRADGGVDGLYAPRRTVIDAALLDAAEDAGAEVLTGFAVRGLLKDGSGRVVGVRITDGGPDERHLRAGVVIGADGLRSRVARLVHAERTYTVPNATANLYAYHQDLGLDGYHWYYALGTAAGTMQTNDGDTCVFASLPPRRFERDRSRGLEAQYHEVVAEVSPELADHVAQATRSSKIRGFAGVPGFLRQSAGPGWALVGDAGYFKDPLTAHGMTDALRDAELLARAVVQGSDAALVEYQTTRDGLAMGLLDVTDRIASLEWDLEEVQDLHHTLSREMKDEVRFLKTLDEAFVTAEAA